MAKRIVRAADAAADVALTAADMEDEAAAIRYANRVRKNPGYLICRAEGRHRPHLERNGTYKDVRPDHATGGKIVETYCDVCEQPLVRRLTSDYRIKGSWKPLYESGEDGYLAQPGEGLSLISSAGRAAFRRMQFEGVPEIPAATKTRQRKTS